MEKSGMAYLYPNRMGRIIFLATEEILGKNGVNVILNLAGLSEFIDHYPQNNQDQGFPFQYISRMLGAIEDYYGPHGGRGVALRIGRASFQYGLREYGPIVGLTDLAFRLLPLQTKIRVGAKAFADIFNEYDDQQVRLEDKGQTLLWHIEHCPVCWDRRTSSPSCQMVVGLLQDALYWVSGGKFFDVEEISCIANGDSKCTIAIDKNPMV
jgi:predicted hydrocarbon binding protein